MKKLIAVAATVVLSVSAAHASTPCDEPGSVTIVNSGNLPTLPPGGNYPIVTNPVTGAPSILVNFAGIPTPVYIRVSQLAVFGIPFSVNSTSPLQMTCGSPNSANLEAIADGLDMTFDFDVDGDSDTIGGTATAWKMANEDGQRFDLKYAKGIRLAEGSRTRLVITVPARYLRVNDTVGGIAGSHDNLSSLTVGLGVGLQVPVSKNWWLTPRVSYSATAASEQLGGDSEVFAATLASNLRLPVPGRGELTMGNLVGYTTSIRTGLTGQDRGDYFKQQNVWFRNGLAYQLPLKSRMFGRQTSIRTSYVFTLGTKDTLAFKQIHEAAINFGFRLRENEQRTTSDLLRVGLMYTHAKNELFTKANYDSLTMTVGYRF